VRAPAHWALVVAVLLPLACETTLKDPAFWLRAGRPASEPDAGEGGTPDGAFAVGGSDQSNGDAGTSAGGAGGSRPSGGSDASGAVGGGVNDGGHGAGARGGDGATGSVGASGGSEPYGGRDGTGGGSGGGGSEASPGGEGGEGNEGGAPDIFDAPPRCTSEIFRDPNESEGPEMMPGSACNGCHHQENAASGEGDAPIFSFAGTLFPSAHEPDSCVAPAAEGALVIVADANDVEHVAVANAVGNFFLDEGDMALPIRAVVTQGGRLRRMLEAAPSVDCNACHTQAGREKAPGRIVLP
jgi:hypothetical protein